MERKEITEESNDNYLYLTPIEIPLNLLKITNRIIESDFNEYKWIFAVNNIHQCLYSLSITSLFYGNFADIQKEDWRKNSKKILVKDDKSYIELKKEFENCNFYKIIWENIEFENGSLSENKEFGYKKRDLIDIKTAIARIQDDFHYMPFNQAITITPKQLKSIEILSNELRNNFVHFETKYQKISLKIIKLCLLDCIEVIEEIINNAILLKTYYEYEQKKNDFMVEIIKLKIKLI